MLNDIFVVPGIGANGELTSTIYCLVSINMSYSARVTIQLADSTGTCVQYYSVVPYSVFPFLGLFPVNTALHIVVSVVHEFKVAD